MHSIFHITAFIIQHFLVFAWLCSLALNESSLSRKSPRLTLPSKCCRPCRKRQCFPTANALNHTRTRVKTESKPSQEANARLWTGLSPGVPLKIVVLRWEILTPSRRATGLTASPSALVLCSNNTSNGQEKSARTIQSMSVSCRLFVTRARARHRPAPTLPRWPI